MLLGGEQMRGQGWNWEAIIAIEAQDGGLDRLVPAEVGEVVKILGII